MSKREVKEVTEAKKKLRKIVGVGAAVSVPIIVGLVFCCNPVLAVNGYNKLVGREAYVLTNKESGKSEHLKLNYSPESIVSSIGEYSLKNIEIDESKYKVTEEDVDDQLDYYLEDYSTSTDISDGLEVEDGYSVNITYKGTIDGKEFEGGSASDQELVIGSGTYIESFEKGLIGHEVGSTFDMDVKFPDDYTEEDLRGKSAVFNVTINAAAINVSYDHTNVTDDIVAKNTEYSTVTEYRESCREELEDYYADMLDNAKKQAVLDTIIAKSNIDIPLDILQQEIDIYEQQFINLYCIDTTLEEYLDSAYGITVDEFRDEISEDVKASFKNVVVCERLAELNNIELTDDDYKAYFEDLVSDSSYGTEEYDEIYKVYTTDYMDGEDYIKRMALCDKVVSELMKEATFSSDSSLTGK